MVSTTTAGRGLALFATACLLSVALPANVALAQKVKNKGTAAEAAPVSSYDLSIPEIETVDSNVDDETLRDIFSGQLVDNAEALAGLDAASITIPEIILDVTTEVDGETRDTTMTFNNFVMNDVVDGRAASVSLGGVAMDAGEEGSADFGELSATNFDIAGMLALYGLVESDGSTELKTIYSDFTFEGGTFEAPEMSCTMGAMEVGELKARPLGSSFADAYALLSSLEEDETPSPQVMGALVRLYADMFTAFETTPATFDGFDCSGEEDGKPMNFSIAGMSMGGMSPGLYPEVSMDGFVVDVEGEGSFTLGNVTIKQMDLSGPLAVLQDAPEALDEAWFTENARALIPAFEGFSFSDFSMDIPDPEMEGNRIAASVGSFDLTLGSYLNGMPTDVATSAENIVFDLPADTEDEQLQQLIDLGITSIDTGFTFNAGWSEAEETIAIEELSITGADLATVVLSGTLANATEALFSADENEGLAATMALAIRNLTLDVHDEGLSDIILASVAADQGSDPATMRPVFAGLAEGSIISVLAGAAEAQKVGAAVSSFVSGKAKHLAIDMTAKDAAGIGLMDFMAAEQDPSALVSKVVVDATAK